MKSTVKRGLSILEPDAYGVPTAVEIVAVLALAGCTFCGERRCRFRVLPCDILPRKHYSLPVIEAQTGTYDEGPESLRKVSWDLAGERTPAPSTLHAWTEGRGAWAQGRGQGEIQGEQPHAVIQAETQARLPQAREVQTPKVDERRYRSEGRRERLAAGARLLLVAALATRAASPCALMSWCARLLTWTGSSPAFPSTSPILFRTGLSGTGSEQVDASPQARSPPK